MTAPVPPARPRRGRRWVRPALAVAFVVVPLVEIWVILQVGQLVGPWWTIVLLVLDSMLGAWLIKREGGRAWLALREALARGRMPAREIADGALILIGGTLMLSPGFVLDILGIRVKDATAGYRLFRRATLEAIDLASVRSTGYVFQTDLAYRTVSRGLRLTEVPIEFVERVRGDSKMSGQVAGESLRMITRWGLSERRRQLRRSRVSA